MATIRDLFNNRQDGSSKKSILIDNSMRSGSKGFFCSTEEMFNSTRSKIDSYAFGEIVNMAEKLYIEAHAENKNSEELWEKVIANKKASWTNCEELEDLYEDGLIVRISRIIVTKGAFEIRFEIMDRPMNKVKKPRSKLSKKMVEKTNLPFDRK